MQTGVGQTPETHLGAWTMSDTTSVQWLSKCHVCGLTNRSLEGAWHTVPSWKKWACAFVRGRYSCHLITVLYFYTVTIYCKICVTQHKQYAWKFVQSLDTFINIY
jgi:NAD-dependent dihydropyrimidine dehydrogenase PreA subunit